jgi:hypothetical protein
MLESDPLLKDKMKDDDIVDQKVFNIDGEKLFDGWFKF